MKWPPLLFTVYINYIVPPNVAVVSIYIFVERGFKCIVLPPTHIFSLHDIKKFCNYFFDI